MWGQSYWGKGQRQCHHHVAGMRSCKVKVTLGECTVIPDGNARCRSPHPPRISWSSRGILCNNSTISGQQKLYLIDYFHYRFGIFIMFAFVHVQNAYMLFRHHRWLEEKHDKNHDKNYYHELPGFRQSIPELNLKHLKKMQIILIESEEIG